MKTIVGLVQMRCTSDVAKNQAAAEKGIREAAKRGARIVCLPELYRGLYFCQTEDHAQFKLAEAIPGPATKALGALARSLKIVIVGSVFERRAPGLYHNTAVVMDTNGRLAGTYRKMHIPDDPLYYEKFYFTPGDLGFQAIETEFGRMGTLVCWDQWYPEAARLTALLGADVLFYPTAIGWHPSEKAEYGERQHSSWETIQRSHAIANGVYVAVANRVGHEPTPPGHPGAGIEFWGQSFFADPSGQIMARGSVGEEQILLADCDFDRIDVQRTHWPFLRDRRIDAYHDITKRFLDE